MFQRLDEPLARLFLDKNVDPSESGALTLQGRNFEFSFSIEDNKDAYSCYSISGLKSSGITPHDFLRPNRSAVGILTEIPVKFSAFPSPAPNEQNGEHHWSVKVTPDHPPEKKSQAATKADIEAQFRPILFIDKSHTWDFLLHEKEKFKQTILLARTVPN